MNGWMHDEFRQLGTDYDSVEEVANYDRRMRQFRDVDAENDRIAELARLTPESDVLEIGTGTGAFARRAALLCRGVTAIDISDVMLLYARQKADEERVAVDFRRAGFLSFEAPDASYDAVVTSLALHHLSDLWKAVALQRIFRWLRPGGRFVLIDVVFDWGDETPEAYFERILEYAPGSRENFAKHIADELSTTTWIMTGLLKRAGFEVESDQCMNDFLHFYQCRKP